MFLINKEIQELQKTLMDVNLISGYFHQASASHLRSVSIAFSTCNESKKARKCGYTDLNFESGNPVKSKRTFSQKHDGSGDETSAECERSLSEVKLHPLTPGLYKKCSTNNCKDPLNASLSHSELFSSEFNQKDEDEYDGCAQKTLEQPSNITKTDLKIPAPGMKSHLNDKQQQDQDSKTLSRYLKNQHGRSYVSKATIKHGLHLLVGEYNHSQNADILNNNKQRGLQEKVSKFVSEISEFKCDVREFGSSVLS